MQSKDSNVVVQSDIEEIEPFGEELANDVLQLVAGGARPQWPTEYDKSSKVCDIGGGCWPDTDF